MKSHLLVGPLLATALTLNASVNLVQAGFISSANQRFGQDAPAKEATPEPAKEGEAAPKETPTPAADPAANPDGSMTDLLIEVGQSSMAVKTAIESFFAGEEAKAATKKDKEAKEAKEAVPEVSLKAEEFDQKAKELADKLAPLKALKPGALNELSLTGLSRLERLRDTYHNFGAKGAQGSTKDRLQAILDTIDELQVSLPNQAPAFLYIPTYQVKGKNGKILSVEILKMDSQVFFGRVNNSPTFSSYKWDLLDLPWLEEGCPSLHQAYQGVKDAEKTDYNAGFEEFLGIFKPRMEELQHSLIKFYKSEHKALGYTPEIGQGSPANFFHHTHLELSLFLSFYGSLDKAALSPANQAALADLAALDKAILGRARNYVPQNHEAKLRDISRALDKFLGSAGSK